MKTAILLLRSLHLKIENKKSLMCVCFFEIRKSNTKVFPLNAKHSTISSLSSTIQNGVRSNMYSHGCGALWS